MLRNQADQVVQFRMRLVNGSSCAFCFNLLRKVFSPTPLLFILLLIMGLAVWVLRAKPEEWSAPRFDVQKRLRPIGWCLLLDATP